MNELTNLMNMLKLRFRDLSPTVVIHPRRYYGENRYTATMTIGKVNFEFEVNIRKVLRLGGERFLYGSKRGYDVNEIARLILRMLPFKLEQAEKREAELAKRMTFLEFQKQVTDPRFSIYEGSGTKVIIRFETPDTFMANLAVDRLMELDEMADYVDRSQAPKVEAERKPMRFTFVDDDNSPYGEPKSLADLHGQFDLDELSMMVVGELLVTEDFRLMRI